MISPFCLVSFFQPDCWWMKSLILVARLETSGDHLNHLNPIGSMYGIYANIWGIFLVNVTIYIEYSIHGSYGVSKVSNHVPPVRPFRHVVWLPCTPRRRRNFNRAWSRVAGYGSWRSWRNVYFNFNVFFFLDGIQ
jgi:hypothetical protein